jgi:hypothetical protein
MYELKKLGSINQIIKNLDLTNSILVQIGMFLNDSDKNCYINEKDERVLRNENDKKLVNDLMNVLLDESVSTNKDLYEKTNQILVSIPNDHELKENLLKVFQDKEDKILNDKENRWEDLKSKTRQSNIENKIKFKKLEGFIKI